MDTKQVGMERTTTSSLVPFQPFHPGRNKIGHALINTAFGTLGTCKDSVISASGTLGTREDSAVSAFSTLGTREDSVISATGTLGTGEDSVI